MKQTPPSLCEVKLYVALHAQIVWLDPQYRVSVYIPDFQFRVGVRASTTQTAYRSLVCMVHRYTLRGRPRLSEDIQSFNCMAVQQKPVP